MATVTSCGACGALAAPEARFCASCGQPLIHRGDERRVVTVLFADLVGFTTLAERRDPEQVKNLVDRCFERLAADISDFGGRVDKVVGDGIVAIFGAPVAHEDDAERAVRAGLRMQRTLSTWAAEVGASKLRMRVGVNTGEVLVGALRAGGDATAMGDVVNTASRLQTVAQPGTVVVGPDTHAATADAVRYTPLGEVRARGREEPVEAWVAEEAVVPPGRRTRRVDVPLVGRDHELALLTNVVDGAVSKGRAATVIVVAEAGMGKTRLVEEVAERAACEHEAAVLEGRCVPYGEANVWWPVAEALRSTFGSPVGTPAPETRRLCTERVRAALPQGDAAEVERIADGLLHLLGEPGPLEAIDPVRAREEVTRSLMAYMDAWTEQRPVIIVMSDLHWADDAVLELIDAMAERAANQRVVVLATARGSLFERWRPALARHTQLVVHLDPLDREAAGELLDRLAVDVPDELRELVLDRSGGNPFFLEELVSLLGEGGRTGVPHTLRGLVSARLDALPGDERLVLDHAAILGRRFTGFAVKVMVSKGHGLSEAAVEAALEGLVAKDLLACDGDLYSFRSELVREVAYGTLTKAMRVKGHVGVASWIESHPTGSAADTDRIAHHYATAATLAAEVGRVESVPGDLPERAVAALDRAVSSADANELHRVVVRLATQALELADDADLEPAKRLRFLLARMRANTAMRAIDDACADLAAAEQVAADAGDPVLAAKVLLRKGDLEQKRGDSRAAAATLDAAIEAFRSAGELKGTADALLAAGINHIFLGEQDIANERLNEGLEAHRALGDRRGEGWALQNLAWVAYSAGRIAEADMRCEESIAIFKELGDRGGLSWAVGMQAFVRFHQGRFEEADALSGGMLTEAEDRGDPWAIGMMHSLKSSLRLWTGRTQEAIEPAEEAVRRFKAMGDWYGQLLGLGTLGRALVSLGRTEEGFAAIDDGLAVAEATTSPEAPLIAITHLITSAAQAGRPDRLDPAIVARLPSMTEPQAEVGFHDGTIAMALLDLQTGRPRKARQGLEAIATGLGEATSGYAWSALALARAAEGDTRGAVEAARTASGLPTSTFSDRVAAATARMLAAARDGDAEAADAALAEAKAELTGTDDRLGRELLSLAAARADAALGRPVSPTAGSEVAADSPGWDTAFRLAAGLD